MRLAFPQQPEEKGVVSVLVESDGKDQNRGKKERLFVKNQIEEGGGYKKVQESSRPLALNRKDQIKNWLVVKNRTSRRQRLCIWKNEGEQ